MMNAISISEEILGLEKKYWQAMREHDLQTAIELTDFPCVVASAHGIRSVDEEQFTQMFNSQDENSIRTVDFDDDSAEVRLVTPNTAIVAYRVDTQFKAKGEERDVRAIDTSTWVKRGDKWVCAMHTETELQKH